MRARDMLRGISTTGVGFGLIGPLFDPLSLHYPDTTDCATSVTELQAEFLRDLLVYVRVSRISYIAQMRTVHHNM